MKQELRSSSWGNLRFILEQLSACLPAVLTGQKWTVARGQLRMKHQEQVGSDPCFDTDPSQYSVSKMESQTNF